MTEREAPPVSACDLPPEAAPAAGPPSPSRVLRFRAGYVWEGVVARAYKDVTAPWQGVARHALVGEGGERAAFHVRYFEIAPGGYSTHEVHEHEHVVIPIRGQGDVMLGGQRIPVGFGDVVYVAPNDPHQFLNPWAEPFGFLCVVPAERDRPRPVSG